LSSGGGTRHPSAPPTVYRVPFAAAWRQLTARARTAASARRLRGVAAAAIA